MFHTPQLSGPKSTALKNMISRDNMVANNTRFWALCGSYDSPGSTAQNMHGPVLGCNMLEGMMSLHHAEPGISTTATKCDSPFLPRNESLKAHYNNITVFVAAF